MHDYIIILCFHILDLLPELKLFFLSENEYILLKLALCFDLNEPECLEFRIHPQRYLFGLLIPKWYETSKSDENWRSYEKKIWGRWKIRFIKPTVFNPTVFNPTVLNKPMLTKPGGTKKKADSWPFPTVSVFSYGQINPTVKIPRLGCTQFVGPRWKVLSNV